MAGKTVIGVDLGGTKIESALIRNSKILKKNQVLTHADKGEGVVLAQLFKAIDAVGPKKASAIGIGSPGPLDVKKGLILNTPNLPFSGFPLVKAVRKRYKIPVRIDNDANCFALGEARYGKGKGKALVVGIILGTGVGGGFIVKGKVFHGRGNAAEFGHMSVATRPQCKCGNLGCLEEHASGRGVVRHARRFGLKGVKSAVEVHQIASLGKGKRAKLAREAYEEMGEMLGIGMTNIINALDPDIIILGGGVSKAHKLFMPVMKQTVKQRCMLSPPEFAISKGPMALLGAASLVL